MSILKPDAVFDGVQHIDFDFLKKNNIKGLLLDTDNTLIDLRKIVSNEILDWVNKAKENGFSVMILSNTNNKEKVSSVAEKLNLEYIFFAKKPSKAGFLKAAEALKLSNENIAMIGDQVFTDVIGANRVGMFSIYVRPIDKKEYWYTAWKRPFESMILKHFGY